MDASGYAFVQGIRSTREALQAWNRRPWKVLRSWLAGSLPAAVLLLSSLPLQADGHRGVMRANHVAPHVLGAVVG